MTQKHLEEIKARCEAATPGKWESYDYGLMVLSENPYGKGQMRIADIRGWGHLTGKCGACGMSDEDAIKIQTANSHFIAHAREDIPKLLEHIEQLQSENTELRARLDNAVELPVRSGQKLYCLHHKYERVLEGVVYQVEYGEGNIDCRCKSDFQVDCSPIKETGNWTLYLHYTKKDIGEKVFFTREEAEKALKERERK